LSKFVELQGLPTVLEVVLSQNVEVQAGAMELLANLAQNGDCRETLTKLGLVDKLKSFAKHRMLCSSSLTEKKRRKQKKRKKEKNKKKRK
jgi:hypothetical protein